MSCFIVSDVDTVLIARAYVAATAEPVQANGPETIPEGVACPVAVAMALRSLNAAAWDTRYEGRHGAAGALGSIRQALAAPLPADSVLRGLVAQFAYQCDEGDTLKSDRPGAAILGYMLVRFPEVQAAPQPSRMPAPRKPAPPADEVF